MNLFWGILLIIVGIVVLKLKKDHNKHLGRILEPEKYPPDHEEMFKKIIKRAKKDQGRK